MSYLHTRIKQIAYIYSFFLNSSSRVIKPQNILLLLDRKLLTVPFFMFL